MAGRPPIDGPSSDVHIVRFGAFELDLRSGELRKRGQRGHLPDQPLQVLALLLEHPGELVTRDELRQRLWPADTYVDFERGLNAAVKRLRDALGDSADTPRFVETLHRRGYRFIAPIEPGVSPVAGTVEQPSTPEPLRSRRRGLALVLGSAALIALAAGGYLTYRAGRSRRTTLARPLTRLTHDPGLQAQPTWSPDGRFIAYSSDHSGNFDIWVQPVAGGDAVQVTHDPAHDGQPDWSPDGGQIVFRSEREGGGLYVVPPLGGHERRLTSFGYTPRWSPDGTRIVFEASQYGPSELPTMYLVGLDGSPPRRILAEFLTRFPVRPGFAWHPDGQRLSFWGWRSGFWTVPVDGGMAVRSERDPNVVEAMSNVSIHPIAQFAWAPSGRAVFFSGWSRSVKGIWRVDIDSKTLRWVGGPERLTTGAGADTEPALSRDGRSIAFVTRPTRGRLWIFPFDAAGGRLQGEGQPVTPQEVSSWTPEITEDGRSLLYLMGRPGQPEQHYLTEKSLPDGGERRLAVVDLERRLEDRGVPLRRSPDGRHVAYKYLELRDDALYSRLQTMDTATGQEQPITSPYQLTPRWNIEGRYENAADWSADGKWIVATGARYADGRGSIALLPLSAAPKAEKRAQVVTSDASHSLYAATMSADDRWIAFQALSTTDERISTVHVVARTGGTWVPVTDGSAWDSDPRWSPDGRMLYFISSRAGVSNLWGRRFDRAAGRPVGDAFPVTSFNGSRQAIVMTLHATDMALARNRLVLGLAEVRGGIWVLDYVDR